MFALPGTDSSSRHHHGPVDRTTGSSRNEGGRRLYEVPLAAVGFVRQTWGQEPSKVGVVGVAKPGKKRLLP